MPSSLSARPRTLSYSAGMGSVTSQCRCYGLKHGARQGRRFPSHKLPFQSLVRWSLCFCGNNFALAVIKQSCC